MYDYVIRGATRDDAYRMAPIMRNLDRQEVWAASLSTPLRALLSGVDTADEAFTALADGVPFCMFGISPLTPLTGVGSPWLLTANNIVTHQKELLRWSRQVAHIWAREGYYTHLTNYIDGRHRPALRWARWVGFSIAPSFPYGAMSLPFHKITLRAEDV